MNKVSLDKVLLDEEFECMICCEEHVCAGNLKRCGNKKCTFRMCDKCFNNLESIGCPNCRQPMEGKKLKSIPEEAMMEEHRTLVDQVEARRLREGRIQLRCLISTCRTGTTLQVPFWGIGASISAVLGYGIQYACCYGNVPCTLYMGFEMCKDHRRTQAQQNNTALLTRIRDFMESRGSDSSSPSDDNIVVANPLVSGEVAPVAPVALAIEDRSSS
jgi:hypothetical protein